MNAITSISTPIGNLTVEANTEGVRRIFFSEELIEQTGPADTSAKAIASNAAAMVGAVVWTVVNAGVFFFMAVVV